MSTVAVLKQRAEIFEKIRAFFKSQGVLEVDTQLLSQATVSDPHIEALSVRWQDTPYYLQTSPEYAMKRLLSAGAPSIYQLGKVFRDDPSGRYHNPEFTMLEWYLLGADDRTLMNQINALLKTVLNTADAEVMTYQTAFETLAGFDPFAADAQSCAQHAARLGIDVSEALKQSDKDTWLQLIFSHSIEPKLGFDAPMFVCDYPASQAALARLDARNPAVAKRFELFIRGIELGNGYDELTDPDIQRKRFEADNAWRKANHLPEKPIDERLMQALEQGLPACSGVALGVDRLIMLALNKTQIADVLPFAWPNA